MSFELGQRVLTVECDDVADDWTAEAIASRKWGFTGEIVQVSDAHGECFQVTHNDGTSGWYEAQELRRVLPAGSKTPSERDFCKAALDAIQDYEDEEGELGIDDPTWVEITKAIYARVYA